MIFLPIICLSLAIFMAWFAHHEKSDALYMIAVALLVASLATGMFSYLAWSIL